MENLNFEEKTSEFIISSTLYRAMFLVKKLQKSALNLQEIKQLFIEDKVIGPKVSDDTVRMTLATLKSVGCEFKKPSAKNNFKYEMIKNPFIYFLDEDDIEFLKLLREQIAQYVSWEKLLKINKLYETLSDFMVKEEHKFELSSEAVFEEIDLDILQDLTKYAQKRVYIDILYSSRNVLKNINIVPLFLRYENESVYLWAYSEKYKTFTYLNVKRIKKINKVLEDKPIPTFEVSKVILKIKKELLDIFKIDCNVKVLKDCDENLEIEVEYLSEFHIIQKILELSPDVVVISPNDIKDKIIQKLKTMMDLYKE